MTKRRQARRAHISLKTKLAAALCALGEIPHEHAKIMSEEQILSLWDWDHWPIPKAFDGPDVHWNLLPRLRPEHRDKTAKIDAPAIAKVRRANKKKQLTPEQEEARRALLKIEGREHEIEHPHIKKKGRWPSRPMQGSKNSKWKVRLTKHGRKIELRQKD